MSQFGDPAKDLAKALVGVEKPTRAEIERSRHRAAQLSRQIRAAHSIGVREENHIGSRTFMEPGDKELIAKALAWVAHHGGRR